MELLPDRRLLERQALVTEQDSVTAVSMDEGGCCWHGGGVDVGTVVGVAIVGGVVLLVVGGVGWMLYRRRKGRGIVEE